MGGPEGRQAAPGASREDWWDLVDEHNIHTWLVHYLREIYVIPRAHTRIHDVRDMIEIQYLTLH